MPVSNKKTILLLAGNYYPELTGIGRYNGEMIDWLAENGYDCTVISTYPYYPDWKVQMPYSNNKWYKKETRNTASGNAIQVFRCPHLVPANPSGRARIMLDISFFLSVFFKVLTLLGNKKFDFVMNVSPPLPLGMVAAWYKQFKGSKFLYHIQDLQVDAARDLQIIRSGKLIEGLIRMERFIINKADVISTISTGMQKKVQHKTNKEVLLFPNWCNTEEIYPIQDKNKLKPAFGFSENDTIILYSGAIGEKQGLEMILSSAALLQQEQNIRFIICGTGPYREKLRSLAAEQQLSNIHFLPLQPPEKLNMFLNMADLHLVIQKASASDLVMPSKLTNILAAGGIAIVTAMPGSSLYEIINAHHLALLAEPENPEALSRVIKQAINSELPAIRKNARNYAEHVISIQAVLNSYTMDAMR